MTSEAACRLLENKLLEMGMYQDEEEPLQFKVDYEKKYILMEERPIPVDKPNCIYIHKLS